MTAVSFVLMQPSTVIALKLHGDRLPENPVQGSRAIAASVMIKASIVAIFGWIIPAPLAMPHRVTSPAPDSPFPAGNLGKPVRRHDPRLCIGNAALMKPGNQISSLPP